jgi:hypothetical protein
MSDENLKPNMKFPEKEMKKMQITGDTTKKIYEDNYIDRNNNNKK